jgi:hypothetical protein
MTFGVSRIKPTIDSKRSPRFQFPEGALTASLVGNTNDHQGEIVPLLPVAQEDPPDPQLKPCPVVSYVARLARVFPATLAFAMTENLIVVDVQP